MIGTLYYKVGDGTVTLFKEMLGPRVFVLNASVTSVADINGYPIAGPNGTVEFRSGMMQKEFHDALLIVDIELALDAALDAIAELANAYNEQNKIVIILKQRPLNH